MAKAPGAPPLGAITWLSAGVALLMIAQQIASKAVRDGFFLDAFDVTALPVATVAASALSFLAALALGRVMRDFPPAASVPVIFGVNAILFFGEAHLIGAHGREVAAFLFLHVAAFSGAVVSGFWSVINERFDPFTAKRVMGRVAGGATIGGMVGGAATWLVSSLAPGVILAALGAINALCGAGLLLVTRGDTEPSRPATQAPAGLLDGLAVLARRSYPRTIALLVFTIALTTACFDYAFKASVTAEARGDSLVGFFAIFYTVTGVATFLLQVAGSRHVLKSVGVVPTIAVLPGVIAAFVLGALVVPGVWAIILLRGAAMVVENSLYRSGYELLYTSVPTDQKRSAKILIDLGCDRLGGAAGSGLALLAIAAVAGAATKVLVVLALTLAIATLGLLLVVQREYVAALASRIRRGAESRPPAERPGAAEYRVAASTFAPDTVGFLVAQEDAEDGAGGRAESAASASGSERIPVSREDLVERVKAHGRSRRAGTHGTTLAPASAAPVSSDLLRTPLLALLERATEERTPGPAWAELAASAPGIIGQLADVLLSGRHRLELRLCAADVLSRVPTERTVAGLVAGLAADEFRIRRGAALALSRIAAIAPDLRPPARRMIELVHRELQQPTRRSDADSPLEQASSYRTDARGSVISPTLELVFTLLSVTSDPAALRLALTAVTSTDRGQRGTGLEYLDNLLPIDLRARLLALVESPEQISAYVGLDPGALAGLAAELRSGAIDLVELRERYRRLERARFEASPATAITPRP